MLITVRSKIQKIASVTAAFVLVVGFVFVQHPGETNAATKCAPQRKATWGNGQVCHYSSDTHKVTVDSASSNYCVEARVRDYKTGKWVHYKRLPRSCGKAVTNTHTGTGETREYGLRMYKKGTAKYTTLCDGTKLGVKDVPSCKSLE